MLFRSKAYDMLDKVVLSSFNHLSVVKCKHIEPRLRTGLLYIEHLFKPEYYAEYTGADALHPHFMTVSKAMVEAAHDKELQVNVYTVNEKVDIEELICYEVYMIITNYPDRVREVITKKL